VRGLHFARIAGIDVYIDWSLLIVFLLIAGSLAGGLFPLWHPEWTAAQSWMTALAAAVLFFGSVLAHELSHALVGRRHGITIRRITLFVFGGMAHMEHEPEKWRAELWMAAVGPVTSLVIGFACLLAVDVFGGSDRPQGPVGPQEARQMLAQLGPASTLLLWLGQVNIILAAFNLVPGFPLDGGRVLRAILWGITGNLRRATHWASLCGQVFAWVLIVTGLAMILGLRVPLLGGGLISGLWLAFIGWFLNNAALMSYRQLLTREALQDVPVSRLMLTRFDMVPPDMSIATLIDDHIMRTGQRAFPVVSGNRLIGMVCLHDVNKVEAARRATTTVADIMTPADQVRSVRPDDEVFEALTALAERNVNQLPVLVDGRVHGLVRREDIVRWLALHGGGRTMPV